jgi:hypothetical protein
LTDGVNATSIEETGMIGLARNEGASERNMRYADFGINEGHFAFSIPKSGIMR